MAKLRAPLKSGFSFACLQLLAVLAVNGLPEMAAPATAQSSAMKSYVSVSNPRAEVALQPSLTDADPVSRANAAIEIARAGRADQAYRLLPLLQETALIPTYELKGFAFLLDQYETWPNRLSLAYLAHRCLRHL